MNYKVTYADKSTKYFTADQWEVFGANIQKNLISKGLATVEETKEYKVSDYQLNEVVRQKANHMLWLSGQLKPAKSMELRKEDIYPYPFKESSVTIVVHNPNAVSIISKGELYCLNGISRLKFGRPYVHEAGIAIKGADIGAIIDFGLGLMKDDGTPRRRSLDLDLFYHV